MELDVALNYPVNDLYCQQNQHLSQGNYDQENKQVDPFEIVEGMAIVVVME